MVFIPFIYFTLLTLYLWRKHRGFDVCVYMSSLYAFTSMCAVIVFTGDMLGDGGILYADNDEDLSPAATAVYCLVLTFSMIPFTLIYNKEIKTIKPSSPFVLELTSWFLISVSMLNLYLVADSTLDILQGNLGAVRAAHYDGMLTPAQIKAEAMPAVFKYLYYFNTSTLLAMPLFFYYLCFEHKPWWFKVLLLFASLSNPIAGIQAADRTEFTFYVMMFIFCLIFFHRYFSKRIKRWLTIFSIPVLALIITYMAAVSIARFDKRDGGAGGSAMQYAGQNYLNFCFFWDNANSDLVSAEREFPMFYHVVKHIDSNNERRLSRSGQQGFFISVFPTFIGDLFLDLSLFGMLSWVIYFFIFSLLIIRRGHKDSYDMGDVIMIFILSAVPIFGIFYYRYFSFTNTLMIAMAVMIYILTKNQIVYKLDEDIRSNSDV